MSWSKVDHAAMDRFPKSRLSSDQVRAAHLEAFRDEILGDLGWSDDEPEPEGEMTYAKNEIRRLQSLAKEVTQLRQALIAKDQEIAALMDRIEALNGQLGYIKFHIDEFTGHVQHAFPMTEKTATE